MTFINCAWPQYFFHSLTNKFKTLKIVSYNIFILFQSADVKNATKNMSLYVLLKPYEPQNVTSEQTSVNTNQYKATPIVKKKSPFVTASQLISMSNDCEVVEGVTNKQSKDKLKSKGQKSVTSFFKTSDKKANKEVGLKLDDLNNSSKQSVNICEKSIFELSDGEYEPYIPAKINRKAASSSNSDYDQESDNQPKVFKEITDKVSELDDHKQHFVIDNSKQPESDAKKGNNSHRKNKTSKNRSVYFDIDDIFGQSPSEYTESKSPNISDYSFKNVNDVKKDCSEHEQDHFQKPTVIGIGEEILMNSDLKKLENTDKEVKNNYKHRKRKLMEDIFGQVEHEASSAIPTKRLKSLDEHEKVILDSKEKKINCLKNSKKSLLVDPVKVDGGSPSPNKRKNSPNKQSEVISYDPTNSSVKHISVAEKPNDLKIKSPSKKEQVSDTVIKCLMPFYKQKMIGDKDLFKYLARAVVHQVILGNQLPGESSLIFIQ